MTDCAHTFINTSYSPKVKVTCSSCRKDVTSKRHREMAKLYQGKSR